MLIYVSRRYRQMWTEEFDLYLNFRLLVKEYCALRKTWLRGNKEMKFQVQKWGLISPTAIQSFLFSNILHRKWKVRTCWWWWFWEGRGCGAGGGRVVVSWVGTEIEKVFMNEYFDDFHTSSLRTNISIHFHTISLEPFSKILRQTKLSLFFPFPADPDSLSDFKVWLYYRFIG